MLILTASLTTQIIPQDRVDCDYACTIGNTRKHYAFWHRYSASIFTAKLQAIFQCLQSILSLHAPHSPTILIITDSLFSLSATSNINSTYPVITRILTLLTTLSITFIWVLSHKDIPHNARIDSATKSTTHRPTISPRSPLSKSDLTISICRRISQHWLSLIHISEPTRPY